MASGVWRVGDRMCDSMLKGDGVVVGVTFINLRSMSGSEGTGTQFYYSPFMKH